jgi:hypothetical protein
VWIHRARSGKGPASSGGNEKEFVMRAASLFAAAFLAVGVTGCGNQVGDGSLGAAEQAQIDPGLKNYVSYRLSYSDNGGGTGTGYVLSATSTSGYRTTVNGQSYIIDRSDEYYNISAMLSNLQSPGSGAAVVWSPSASLNWPTSGAISNFANVNVARTPEPVGDLTWTSSSTTPSSAFSDGSSMAVAFGNLSYSSGTWSGSLDWYSLGSSAPSGDLISSSSAVSLSWGSAPAASGGNSWWHASASVTSVYLP